jgi:hypothetical protein
VDYYGALKDFAGPGATVVAALSAVAVTAYFSSQHAETAKRQARTAKDQLRLNLFDKRYAVYKDIEKFLKTVVNDVYKPGFGAFDTLQLFVFLDEAAFFFSPTTCEWLQTVREDCGAFLLATANRVGEEAPQEHADLHHTVVGHLSAMPERFRDDLSFSQPRSD